MLDDDAADDPLSDEEWPDEDDPNAECDVESCPSCGGTVAEGAPKCPHCGEWIIPATQAGRRLRTGWWPLLVGGLILMILVLWHGLRF